MTEQERVERFEAAYNRIDRALSELTERSGDGRRRTYASKVRIAANRMRRLSRHVDFLLEIGDLRNAIVHNRLGDGEYIAVPNERTVLELEKIEETIFAPERVIPRFERRVYTLQHDESLAEAAELVKNTGFSRFPVYEGKQFVGILTANGLARWIIGHAANGTFHCDARAVRIEDVLREDHRRDFVEFISADTAIDDAAEMFRTNPRLEALLITRQGRPDEPAIGLIAAGDVVAHLSR